MGHVGLAVLVFGLECSLWELAHLRHFELHFLFEGFYLKFNLELDPERLDFFSCDFLLLLLLLLLLTFLTCNFGVDLTFDLRPAGLSVGVDLELEMGWSVFLMNVDIVPVTVDMWTVTWFLLSVRRVTDGLCSYGSSRGS